VTTQRRPIQRSKLRRAPLILDHVQIAAPPGAEPEARRFYGELLALEEIEKPEPMRASGGVWFRLAQGELHVGIEDPFTPARKAHPALRVDPSELDGLAERLASAGAPVEWDERYPGVRRFYTADPFGNRVELLAGPA
jgi:catechol 2,3-dioxygenase-like lactoylglutathione lyase family enzyme